MRSDSSSPAVPAIPVSDPSSLDGRIVLPYKEPQLVHIGTRSMRDFHERCPRSTPTGAPHASRHLELRTVEQCIQAAAGLEWNQSEGKLRVVGYADCCLAGFVVRDALFNRVKALSLHPSTLATNLRSQVKSPSYVSVHHGLCDAGGWRVWTWPRDVPGFCIQVSYICGAKEELSHWCCI